MTIDITHDQQAQNYALKRAICLYEGGQGAIATLHDVSLVDNVPTIGAGVAVEKEAFVSIAAQLQGQSASRRQIIEVPLLVLDPDLLCWYRPSESRIVFFKTKDEALNALSGEEALHPPLLFIARPNELYVYALDSDARPDAKTPLFNAPYFNLYANAHLCEGNYRLPQTLSPDSIEGWERAFFDTSFSHTNLQTKELTKWKDGHNALWRHLRGCAINGEPFPFESLVPRKQTLGQVLGGFR